MNQRMFVHGRWFSATFLLSCLYAHSKWARVNEREQRQKAKTVFALKFNLFVENAEPIVLNFSFVVKWNLLGDCREYQIKEEFD